MTRMRTWMIIAILFLSVIFNLDQAGWNGFASRDILNPSFYTLVFIGIVFPLLFPALGNLPIFISPLILSAVYFLLRVMLPTPPLLSDSGFTLHAIIILFILSASGILGILLARALRQAKSSLNINQSNNHTHGDLVAREQKALKDEFLRIKQNNRPIALLILQPDLQIHNEIAANLHADTAQNKQTFVYRTIKEAITQKARFSDIAIGHTFSGRFLLSCPDTNKVGAITLITRLHSAVKDQLGIDIKHGVAIYPDDSLVFEELQQIAEDRLNASSKE